MGSRAIGLDYGEHRRVGGSFVGHCNCRWTHL
ncbi:hypothetical protein LINPERHAP1_LOCUS21291 [Linum perenne]